MDIPWNEYRPLLRRCYFGDNDNCIAPVDSSVFDDFWAFFKKYYTMMHRKGIKSDRDAVPGTSTDVPLNEHGIPSQSYTKTLRKYTNLDLDKTARYSLRQVPNYIVAEFEYVLHTYVEFLQREKIQKLKKLRKSQRTLPIGAYRQEIVNKVKENSVVIIAGDTGCGKSTQVPQYLLHSGLFEGIACTQPRRIACTSLAKRVAFETLHEFGSKIAYQIRFEKTKTMATKMLFLTEGLLLRQLSTDPQLSAYQVIILDEIHERHLHGDFVMGILRLLVKERTDLKLILMSATVNLELFSAYFHGAPVIQVPGRLYPIEMQYMPTKSSESDPCLSTKKSKQQPKIDAGPYVRILQLIDRKYPTSERGDALIFLSGISEMSTVAEKLKEYAEQTKGWIILMLHSTLSLEEQDHTFDVAPDGVRKCVLSTNIAETSVTIDGVRFVIDSGKVKEMRYDSVTRMHMLKEIWVSQASGEQRKGRAGRTGPGICYRLYSNEQFDSFDKYSTSEINRVSLESLVLQMYHLNLPNPDHFPFIEPPPPRSMKEAVEGLKDQGALRSGPVAHSPDELTPLGRMLVNLPVDVSLGKALVMGCLFRQVEAILTITAGMSVQSPFTNRSYRDMECMSLRKNLLSDHGDPFSLMITYREWLQVKSDGGSSSKKWTHHRGIEEQRLYEVTKLRRQFKELLEDADLIEKHSMAELASMGSSERRIRKGEMKRLRDLKRKHQNDQRKRKVLKPDHHYDSIATANVDFGEEESGGSRKRNDEDVQSVEFQIRHTDKQLAESLDEHKLNHESASLIKVIVCSALYPQYAVLDVHNSCKHGHDQMAHSKAKSFLVLHPNSCLAQDPEVLAPCLDKHGNSANHQLIFYGMLLETTKPYVVNSIRVAALHTLLLLARKIDCSHDFTRVICDDFVEFNIIDSSKAENIVAHAAEMRILFARCLEKKLEGNSYQSDDLSKRLLEYLESEVVYNMRRLVQATADSPKEDVEQKEEFVPQTNSVSFEQFLNVGSIGNANSADPSPFISTKWTCPTCHQEIYCTTVQRLEHMQSCIKEKVVDMEEQQSNSDSHVKHVNPNANTFYCHQCNKNLMLTPVQFLKHRKCCNVAAIQ